MFLFSDFRLDVFCTSSSFSFGFPLRDQSLCVCVLVDTFEMKDLDTLNYFFKFEVSSLSRYFEMKDMGTLNYFFKFKVSSLSNDYYVCVCVCERVLDNTSR